MPRIINFKWDAGLVGGKPPVVKPQRPPKCKVCNRSSKSFTAGGKCPVDGNKGATR